MIIMLMQSTDQFHHVGFILFFLPGIITFLTSNSHIHHGSIQLCKALYLKSTPHYMGINQVVILKIQIIFDHTLSNSGTLEWQLLDVNFMTVLYSRENASTALFFNGKNSYEVRILPIEQRSSGKFFLYGRPLAHWIDVVPTIITLTSQWAR